MRTKATTTAPSPPPFWAAQLAENQAAERAAEARAAEARAAEDVALRAAAERQAPALLGALGSELERAATAWGAGRPVRVVDSEQRIDVLLDGGRATLTVMLEIPDPPLPFQPATTPGLRVITRTPREQTTRPSASGSPATSSTCSWAGTPPRCRRSPA